jgi:hypothetical protein
MAMRLKKLHGERASELPVKCAHILNYCSIVSAPFQTYARRFHRKVIITVDSLDVESPARSHRSELWLGPPPVPGWAVRRAEEPVDARAFSRISPNEKLQYTLVPADGGQSAQ